ncbi:ABC transporter permease [Oceanisphaera sp. DM8]|uniref:ABC transporter permease n=1 Tax=Oceanisphaera pacifica TaxID=2818389 RepID=A0ABS3NIA1_9GAMM|nr:ABC transporter permease [Oceanisphaera pacifica]
MRTWLGLGLPMLLLLIMTINIEWLAPLFNYFVDERTPAIYSRDSVFNLLLWHLAAVFIAISAATLVALFAGIWVTRTSGREFLPLARAIANLGQTFPPVAVLALAVPALGFGLTPTLVALFLYGMLPIYENTVTGLQQVPERVCEAARGMGMSPHQRLWSIELPLALPVIVAGIRISLVISIGTATIGSTVAAKGFGEVIIAGLLTDNMAFVLQGGIMVALMAIITDSLLQHLERRLSPAVSRKL